MEATTGIVPRRSRASSPESSPCPRWPR